MDYLLISPLIPGELIKHKEDCQAVLCQPGQPVHHVRAPSPRADNVGSLDSGEATDYDDFNAHFLIQPVLLVQLYRDVGNQPLVNLISF